MIEELMVTVSKESNRKVVGCDHQASSYYWEARWAKGRIGN